MAQAVRRTKPMNAPNIGRMIFAHTLSFSRAPSAHGSLNSLHPPVKTRPLRDFVSLSPFRGLRFFVPPSGTVRDVRFRNLCSVWASPDVPHAAFFRNSLAPGQRSTESAFTNPVSLCNAGGSAGAAREFRLPRAGRYPKHGKRRSRSAWSDGLNMLPSGTRQRHSTPENEGGDFNDLSAARAGQRAPRRWSPWGFRHHWCGSATSPRFQRESTD